jgi:hypothetical protein
MNIVFYYTMHPSPVENMTAGGIAWNGIYASNVKANIEFTANNFPESTVILISDDRALLNLNLPNLLTIETHPRRCSPNSRQHQFLTNYFHYYEKGHEDIIKTFIERWFIVYDALKANEIENFVGLDSDCLLLEDITQHDYKKIGINIVSNIERCWGNSLICSTTHLNEFLDFVCSFYADLHTSQKSGGAYIDSFFKNPKQDICDMALWYLMYQNHPNLFVNNLTIDSNNSVHDLVLGYDPKDPDLQKEYQKFTTQNDGGIEVRKVIYTEDGPCFEERETQKLIKAKSLHFSPGDLKFKIKPFIEEYQKIYRKALYTG